LIEAAVAMTPDAANAHSQFGSGARKENLVGLFDETCDRWRHREALYFEGRRWSFDELRREVDRVAQRFHPAREWRTEHNDRRTRAMARIQFSHLNSKLPA
jgi:non-ribosomal peptide synthetase component E (peptide arylation enzyme)